MAAGKYGRQSLVFDPMTPVEGVGVGPRSAWVTDDFFKFETAFWSSRFCLVFIDEGLDVSKDYADNLRRMFTKGRHIQKETGGGGHSVTLIAQTFMYCNATARKQTTQAFIFRCAMSDARALADQFAAPELLKACSLQPLNYYHVDHTGKVTPGRL
jgi:hypothetical protein